MSLSSTLYNIFLRRTSTFAMTIVTAAFVFERTFDIGVDYMWRANNKGVS
jgi:ubiquinol-cytochrome c reductase subunit 9